MHSHVMNTTDSIDYAYNPPTDGLAFTMVVIGTVLGMLLIIIAGEMMASVCRNIDFRKIIFCQTFNRTETESLDEESTDRRETLV